MNDPPEAACYLPIADRCRIPKMGMMKRVAAWTAMALSTLPLWIGGACGSDSTGSGGSAGSSGSTGGSSTGSAGDSSGSAGTTGGSNGSSGSGTTGGSTGSGGSSTGTGGAPGDAAVCSYFAPNGYCPGTLKCRCCRTLGAQNCTCSTECGSNGDCHDPSRSACVEIPFGFCAPTADFCKAP